MIYTDLQFNNMSLFVNITLMRIWK